MIKRKNAPNLKEAWNNQLFSELIILAGSKAWNTWSKGDGIGWRLLVDGLHIQPFTDDTGARINPYDQSPVILDKKQLEEIQGLQIANSKQKHIRIFQCGKLTSKQITALCLNLANYTDVENVRLFDNALQLVEDLSGYIKRLRTDEETANLADKFAPQEKIDIDLTNDKPKQNHIAEAFLSWVDKPMRRDDIKGEMLEYNGIFWEVLSEIKLSRKVLEFYEAHNGDYTARQLKAIADLVTIKADEIPQPSPDFIGFNNGVLNKKTGEFIPHNIRHYLRHIEKFDCKTDSFETPYFDDWLSFVADGNEQKKQTILAGLYMVLTNRNEWGLFLEATGVAGSGKSVFSRIASIINGENSTAYISLQELESDKKRAMLIGKSLAISPDQKPYKGGADELKIITGGDKITVKLNYVNDFSIALNSVFMLVTNYPLLFTDRNGGIARRRIIIPFEKAIPKEKKDVNFTDKVKSEVFGIVNKLLALFPNPEHARAILEQYRDNSDGLATKRQANHLIDFAKAFCIDDNIRGLPWGSFKEIGKPNERTPLYNAYLHYCRCHNIKQELNKISFKQAFPDALKETGERKEIKEKKSSGYFFTNIKWRDFESTLREWEN